MTCTILSIKLTEAPPTREMYVRPWIMTSSAFSSNENLQSTLSEVTHHGTNLSFNALAPIANSILVPDSKVTKVANIGGSYTDRRFAVEIIVKTISSEMLEQFEIITGYTDHFGLIKGLTGSDEIDPNMLLMINGVADVSMDHYAGNTSWNVSNISQILSPVTGVNAGETVLDKNMVACRPSDVLSVLATGAMSGVGNRTTINSMVLSSSSRRSSRANNVAAHFLSNTLTAHRDNLLDAGNEDGTALLNAAGSQIVAEPALSAGAFLNSLRQRTQFSGERAITWKELALIDPTLRVDGSDQRITVVPLTVNAQSTLASMANSSEYWNSAYVETLVGQRAVSSIPAWMSTRGIGEIDIEAHNATTTGEVIVNIHSIRGIKQGVDVRPILNRLKSSFTETVFAQLKAGNGIGTLYIRASMGLVGVANLVISVNGGDRHPYNAPIFNDASYSLCMAGNLGQLNFLANDLGDVCASVTNHALGSNMDYQMVVGQDTIGNPNFAIAQSPTPQPNQPRHVPNNTDFLSGGLNLNF